MSGILHHKISNETMDQNNSSEKIVSTRDNICKVIRFIGYVTCLSLALVNSWAIFRSYASNIKIKSTKVVPSPGNFLDSPLILLGNSSAYKDQILPTSKVFAALESDPLLITYGPGINSYTNLTNFAN